MILSRFITKVIQMSHLPLIRRESFMSLKQQRRMKIHKDSLATTNMMSMEMRKKRTMF